MQVATPSVTGTADALLRIANGELDTTTSLSLFTPLSSPLSLHTALFTGELDTTPKLRARMQQRVRDTMSVEPVRLRRPP